MTESEEDEEEKAIDVETTGDASDENMELLAELSAEDKKKGKKEKKEKKKKAKGKKAAAEGDEEGENEGAAKKKKKKPKKEKKVKEADEEEVRTEAGKKLSKKKVIPVILSCMTILLCIIVFTIVLPEHMQKRDARIAYDMGNYEAVYDLLYGKDLNEDEEVILHKTTLILKMERKIKSYYNYMKLNGRELEALNALVQGAALYYELLPEAEEYHVTGEIGEKYQQILAILSERYNLSEADVMDIIYSEDDIIYTQKITAVLFGAVVSAEDTADEMADVLPEEQEILDGLPEETEDMVTDDIVTDDILNGSSDGMAEENAAGENAAPENADAASGEEVKYIEPVSVEVHQNN